MTANIRSDISKIGWYQILGGGMGLLIIILSLFSIGQFSGSNIIVYVLMLLFFAYSIFCGILCLKYSDKALLYSLINQFLQLISFALFGFAFTYVAGLNLSIGLDLTTSIEIDFGLDLSKFAFNINREHERSEINLNLIAFGLIYWIDKLMSKIKGEKINSALT